MAREYVIYADESAKTGPYYSNFYGGALVRSEHIASVRTALEHAKQAVGLGAEAKWQKISRHYVERYVQLMDSFFDFVKADRIKVRIMFRQNVYAPRNLTKQQRENEYFLLYYQFIKHAFGLSFSNPSGAPVNCRLYFDRLPDTREKVAAFKGHLCRLSSSPDFRRAGIRIRQEQITEVVSHDHVVLQCLDVVLGSVQFRLNDKHKAKPPGSRTRGGKTVAKEKVYRHINRRIRLIYPNFNVGISTGIAGDRANHWRHPYRHWLFVPADHARDMSRTKP